MELSDQFYAPTASPPRNEPWIHWVGGWVGGFRAFEDMAKIKDSTASY